MTAPASAGVPDLGDIEVPPPLRPATPDDAEAIFDLVVDIDRRLTGDIRHTLADVHRDLESPHEHAWLEVDESGRVRASVEASAAPGNEHAFAALRHARDLDDESALTYLRFGLSVARRLGPGRPVHVPTHENDERSQRWLEELGAKVVRRFGRMDIALDGNQQPDLPADVTVRNLEDTDDDWRVLYDVIEMAFRDHFGHVPQSYDDYVAEDRPWVDDYSLCWLASVDGKPAAAALCKERPAGGYVGVLGTLREFRGRGLGTLLLRIAFAEFARRGHSSASLNVDLSNPTGAVGVYESAGMHLASVDLAYEFPAA